MYDDGYFKKGYQELTDEHANKNYDKAIRWIEKGIIPQFLLDDINEYIKSKKQINNILNKYKIEDIKIVIDKKVSEWINNPKMSSYLRPETLLGSKFERYLYHKYEPKTIKDITLADIQKAKAIRDGKING